MRSLIRRLRRRRPASLPTPRPAYTRNLAAARYTSARSLPRGNEGRW